MTQPTDLLITALEVFERWRADGGDDGDELLCRHPELAPWLEPLLADAQGTDAGSNGERPAPHRSSVGLSAEVPAEASGSWSVVLDRIGRRAAAAPGETRYEIGEEIARGGMGAILRAFDRDLRRTLAMKVVVAQADDRHAPSPATSARALDRFLAEAQITGQLEHPGVVPVHDLGVDEHGRTFFTMRLVQGSDLGAVFAMVREHRNGWNVTRALGVLQRVAETMAYAHSKGILHRDLKPKNIMVGGFGEVYVMDWGLARVLGEAAPAVAAGAPAPTDAAPSGHGGASDRIVTDRHDTGASPWLTLQGEVVGTPAYMAPEQARGALDDLGPRADVYAVGAILYELLTGHAPYTAPGDRPGPRDLLRRVQERPPAAITAAHRVPPELVAICERAMARAPDERYPDFAALGSDLRAYLEGRVVQAYRTGPWVELLAWTRRNRALAAAATLFVLALIGGLAGTLAQSAAARRSELAERATAERERQARQLADGHRLSAQALVLAEERPTLALQLALAGADMVPPGLETNRALYGALATHHEVACLRGHEGYVKALATSADGRWITSADDSGLQILWDAQERRLVHRWDEHEVWSPRQAAALFDAGPRSQRMRSITAVGFSQDGAVAFSAGVDGTLRLWDVATGRRLLVAPHPAPVLAVVMGPGGDKAYTACSDGVVRSIDVATGGVRDLFVRPGRVWTLACAGGWLVGADATAWLAVPSADATARELQADPARLAAAGGAAAAAISADGGRVLVASSGGDLSLWDVAGARLLESLGASLRSTEATLSPDGNWAYLGVSADRQHHRIRDLRTGRTVAVTSRGATNVLASFSPDSRLLALNQRVVDLAAGQVEWKLEPKDLRTFALAWLDARRLVTAGEDRTVRIWDLDTAPRLAALSGHDVTVDPSGRRGVVTVPPHTMPAPPGPAPQGLVDLETGATVDPLDGPAPIDAARFAPTGRYVALFRLAAGSVLVWDLEHHREILEVEVDGRPHFAFGARGLLAVVDGRASSRLRVLDVLAEDPAAPLVDVPAPRCRAVAFSPDGARLVTALAGNETALVWSVRGEVLHTLRGARSQCVDAAFSPDGALLAVSFLNQVWIYDAGSFHVLCTIDRVPKTGRLCWAPDAIRLVVSDPTGGRALCDARAGAVLMEWPDHHPQGDGKVGFGADDAAMLATTSPGVVEVLPLDPAARARALLPRELSADEMADFRVGTVEQRERQRRDELVAEGTTRSLAQRAAIALEDGDLDAGFRFLDRAAHVRPRGPMDADYHLVRARALCRRAAERDADGALDAAFDALRRAVALGLAPARLDDAPDLAALRALPAFAAWRRALR